MSIETHVVVLQEEAYNKGTGYRGPIMKSLGFPEGPYVEGVAKLFVRQARSVDKTKRFKVVKYVAE